MKEGRNPLILFSRRVLMGRRTIKYYLGFSLSPPDGSLKSLSGNRTGPTLQKLLYLLRQLMAPLRHQCEILGLSVLL